MIPPRGAKITIVVNDEMGRYLTRAIVVDIEPPSPYNRGQSRVRYGAGTVFEWVSLHEEGLTWCRGWEDPEALLAANSLAESTPR